MKQDRERLLKTQPRAEGKFAQLGPEPLSKRVRTVRLHESVDELIEAHLPQSERAAWFRRVIAEAAEREFIEGQKET